MGGGGGNLFFPPSLRIYGVPDDGPPPRVTDPVFAFLLLSLFFSGCCPSSSVFSVPPSFLPPSSLPYQNSGAPPSLSFFLSPFLSSSPGENFFLSRSLSLHPPASIHSSSSPSFLLSLPLIHCVQRSEGGGGRNLYYPPRERRRDSPP